jgi:pilus assembly protein CpaB
VAAVAAALVVYDLSNNVARQQGQTAISAPTVAPAGIKIVVAAQDIPAATVILTDMLTLKEYPTGLVPVDAYTQTASIVGSTTTTRVIHDDPVRRAQFLPASGRVGSSLIVPEGKVLAAFPSTDILNSTGAVQPGDHVDILITMPISGTARLDAGAGTESQVQGGARGIVSQATLQNVEVYSTGEWTPPEATADKARSLKIITFLVDHQEALILKFVKDSGGVIDLVVRSLKETQPVTTDPVNLDYLVDLYKFIGLPKSNP